MFTGLVEGAGEVKRLTPHGPDVALTIAPPWPAAECVLGESIAVNGACLTVTRVGGADFTADVSAESLGVTSLGRLGPGSLVNLERALRLGDRLGGHLVSGHVDCLGRVSAIGQVGASYRLTIAAPAEHLRMIVPKGSVTVDGISLTVNRVSAHDFELNIIPHTWAATTLRLAKEGDSVNIETDLIGKYVARLLNRDGESDAPQGGLTLEDLARMGY